MKRILAILAIMALFLSIPPITQKTAEMNNNEGYSPHGPQDPLSLSSASGGGNARTAVQFASHQVTGLSLSLENSYSSPNAHSGVLDLSSYLVQGWSLYKAEISANSMTAIAEHETTGITQNTYISIENATGLITDILYQEFYKQPQDGKLENYTISYYSNYYSEALGIAYLGVRSNYSDKATNTTGWITPFTQIFTKTSIVHDTSADNAILDSDKSYYVVIDGSAMQGFSTWFNTIHWAATSSFEGLETGYHLRGVGWDIYDLAFRREADLQYMYTPWNKTSNSVLTYTDPAVVALQGNSSSLYGSTWTFTDPDNITQINFNSNQSLSLDYDLTLWYKRTASTIVDWSIPSSGAIVDWSVETTLEFPSVTQANYLNLSIPSSWSPEGLFNSTHTTSNHTAYSSTGTAITCAQLYNETWTLKLTSENLMKTLKTYRTNDDIEVTTRSMMNSNIDINSTIQQPDANPVTTGSVNLVIWYSGGEFWTPSDKPVTSGKAYYIWDISSPKSTNGEYRIEAHWSNGSEAGYLSKTLVLYYPSSLTAASYDINAYTESSFDISCNFTDLFTPQGINSSLASLVYSLDGAANQSMTYLNNGIWNATISTAGKTYGLYSVMVYATGYAIENSSLLIHAYLIHDTESLTVQWSNSNDITYVESTELSVAYRRVGGTPISGATVNVTIGAKTWTLAWDGPSETYKMTFNGSDVPPGYGVHSLTIEAWKAGYKPQSDSSQMLTLQEEPTTLVLQWSNGNNITYVESTTLSANYTMSDGSPVLGALVNVTIGTDTWIMTWNGASETYDYTFVGNADPPGFGLHGAMIEAGKFGFVYKSNSSLSLQLSEEPTSLVLSWSSGFDITYVEQTYLIANYTMGDGSAVVGATLNVTIGTDYWALSWDAPTQTYRILFKGSDSPPGFGAHSVTVKADLFGFVSKTDSDETLTISEEPTNLVLLWSDGNSITYIEQTTLSAAYTMSNGSVVRGASVNVTIGLDKWQLAWHEGSQTYRVTFFGTDVPPGFGTHSLTVEAALFGYVSKSDTSEQLIVSEEPTTLTIGWSEGSTITYIEQTTLSVWYNMSDGSPVTGATVTVTIETDVWILVWNPLSEAYETTFSGTNDPPGFGTHPISIEASKTGFESKLNDLESLVIILEPTSLQLQWWLSDTITYVGQTVLYANFTMSNGSAVTGAYVTAVIGSANKTFEWNPFSEVYSLVLSGNDPAYLLGSHMVRVQATFYGYEQRNNNTQTLTVQDEPTTLTPSWSPSNSISFIGSTLLSVRYDMSNGTAIKGATVNATIGTDSWPLVWNSLSDAYEHLFLGTDAPPGIGVHNLVILADLYGFQNNSVLAEQLTIHEEVTDLVITWSNGNDITYVESTTLIANYTMSDGSPVLGAQVNITIGLNTWTLAWNELTGTYNYTFHGNSAPPGLGTFGVGVEADKFGFEYRIDSLSTLTLRNEPTTLIPSWSPDNNITYFESATLSVMYRMSNGTAIPGAVVNITIDSDVWILIWNPLSESYEITISGADSPPGYGTHNIELRASKYGYDPIIDSTLQLIIRLEETKVSFEWVPSDTITFVEQTKIRVFYLFSNGTPIQGATVNITRGPTTWIAAWSSTSQSYEFVWYGSDDPPGFGSHLLTIKAWKANYVGIIDASQTLTINEEPTQITASWLNGNNITFVESSKLLVNYTTGSGVVIPDALVDVTIGTDNWQLAWNSTSQLYEKVFSGSEDPPGLGSHTLSVRGWKFGFETSVNSTVTLTIRVEPTTLTPTWNLSDTITYVESTTLSVIYETSSGDSISGADVSATIGTDIWVLAWNPISEAYEVTFSGSDSPPGLGVHSLTIQASCWGYQDASNTSETLTIVGEPTNFVISWSEGNNITYVKGTTLSVRYQMSNFSSITGADVNVTINGVIWPLIWNSTSEAYERYFAGSDDQPGYGTHTVVIKASKFGYELIIDSSQQLTIRLEDTYFTFDWQPSNTITYVESTKIRIYYHMSNGTLIDGATVNATGATTWIAIWNSTNQAYEISFLGTDDPPGLGSHQLIIQAWKANYVGITDGSQIITVNEEPTQIHASWSNGNSISFTEATTLLVEYKSSYGITIPLANVNVTIGTHHWPLVWNSTSQLYEITFRNGTSAWPGLGTFGLTIRAKQFGYGNAVDISQTLTINSEQVKISSILLGGSTITYVGSTVLVVNYTTTAGAAVVGAIINVTIDGTLWNLTWDPGSETYRIRFNGSDSLPGFGTHNLLVNASCPGFDPLPDYSKFLIIIEEPTSLNIFWEAPNFNNVTYFDYTILYVEYKMSNGTIIKDATVNVTIGTTTWNLDWNSSQMAYSLRFNGSDVPPGLGIHGLTIEADKYGYVNSVDNAVTLILSKDPTTLEVSWISGNNISYIEKSTLSVVYKMSNGSDILGALVSAAIGSDVWVLNWNSTARAYQVHFTGDQNPPGLGSFSVVVQASADVFVTQVDYTSLTIHTESTTATPSWSAITIDWTQSIIFSVDFRNSYGNLIGGATTKSIFVNGTEYELLGTNGTFWMEFNNTFDLGIHSVWANIGKFGYESASVLSVSFTVTEAPTDLNVQWSSATIDYLGQSDLTLDYYYTDTGLSVPSAGVIANITIDGTRTIRLTLQGGYWIANLTGISLDLGVHAVIIQAWVYGYEFSQTSDSLTVNEVSTDPLLVGWNPTNLTIEYTDYFDLTVDYTYYGGDVLGFVMVNVTVDGRLYILVYSGGLWSTSIPGSELKIGLHTATVSAWSYGYAPQTAVTTNLNVTAAANTFEVTWEPWNLSASYIDIVNVSVVYTQDFVPIPGATVQLLINNTPYSMTYSAADERWSFSMRASVIGLGMWNVTVTANKTGYLPGWDSGILTISPASSNLIVLKSATSIYYDENVTFDIYYQLLNTSVIPGAALTFEVDGTARSATWEMDHWTYTDTGESLGVGIHSVYISVGAFGFETATESFDVTVNAIPTSVATPLANISMFAHESITVSVTWLDEKNSVTIPGYIPEVAWPDSFSIVDYGNGTYSIHVNSAGLHVGSYELQINFVKTGYENGTRLISIDVLELPIVLIYDEAIVQYENESISIDIEMFDGPHAAVVDWGEITLELDGVQHTLVYNSESQLYSIQIWLSSLSPGNYSLNFTASAIDCETDTGVIRLEIMPKTTYELTLEVSEEVKTGQQIQITVLATSESHGASGLSITVHIVIDRRNKAPQVLTDQVTTISDGLTTLEITVPSDATSLTIWAEFEGSISQWPAISDTVYRETSPGGFDILAFIFSLFSNPVTLIITLGIFGGPLAGALFYRRRRGIPTSTGASMVESTITEPTSFPPPASELDLIQDLIKSSPAGLTRVQIAQKLEISTSKASAILKKLLDSDTRFNEIREGKLRRVVFKGDE